MGEMAQLRGGDRPVKQDQVQPFTPAAFRRAWVNESLTCAAVGAVFGIGEYAARRRAKALGLKAKALGQRPKPGSSETIRLMWIAGVSTIEIAAHLGLSQSGISVRAAALGLPKRGRGWRPQMTLAQYRETLLAKAMAETARIEQRQIKLAEMWDQPGHHTSGKRKAA